MAKRFAVLVGVLAVLFVAAVPALAEAEKGFSEAGEGSTKEGPPVEKEATRVGQNEKPSGEYLEADTREEEAAGERYARAVEATGVLRAGLPEDVAANGSHSISDASSTTYALRSESVDLDEYVGEQVIVHGVTVPGSGSPAEGEAEGRFGSGSLPLLEIYQVEPTDGPDGPPVYCAAIGCKPGDPVTVTFELTIEGEVPEGRSLAVYYPDGGTGAPHGYAPLCASDPEVTGWPGPTCEDGGVYTASLEMPKGEPATFFFGIKESGVPVEPFFKDTRTFDKDETVDATYRADEEPRPGDEVTTTGVLRESGEDCNKCAKHVITDETSGKTYYLISDPQSPFGDYVDLGSYAGQRVTVSGTLQMQGENNLRVTSIEPVGSPGEFATFSFELTVECEPPADAEFLSVVRAGEGGPGTRPLTDPDGDGLYTGTRRAPKFLVQGTRPPGLEPSSLPVQIVQGPPTGSSALGPEFRVIKDFGLVEAADETFAASVSFCHDGGNGGSSGGSSGSGSSNGSGDGGSGSSGSDSGSFWNGGFSIGGSSSGGGIRVFLPSTGGGAALTVLGAGVVLIGGGLLVRRLTG